MKATRLTAVIFHRFGPYHQSRLQACAERFPVLAIEEAAQTSEYAWDEVDRASGGFERLTLLRHGETASRYPGQRGGPPGVHDPPRASPANRGYPWLERPGSLGRAGLGLRAARSGGHHVREHGVRRTQNGLEGMDQTPGGPALRGRVGRRHASPALPGKTRATRRPGFHRLRRSGQRAFRQRRGCRPPGNAEVEPRATRAARPLFPGFLPICRAKESSLVARSFCPIPEDRPAGSLGFGAPGRWPSARQSHPVHPGFGFAGECPVAGLQTVR